ncbi:Rpn family recombination-promoting nuclease/putative transposase [Methanoplanus endosymbiosus]|uniref:Rpn family recombination-promoting nuclease/putative transposase n=1 Tax=Methanoplanus endosymbiosus TaxID=33865 RepID=A0A9E7THL0_9EURY|nr:Rpn family recombination-promoting nuclease/putative transposase [Methanoplanus endosymbiosus]UUX93162.1 Rpn family recombination-promoting nuclease/putative transposase [Methanoplanus endosymbiosus]
MTKRNFPPEITTADGSFIMSPKNDFAFRLLFGDEKNKEITISFLRAMLKIPVKDITIKDPFLLKQVAGDKTGILDIRIVLDTEVQVDVEIQLSDHPAIKERVLFYQSRLYASQISSGEDYRVLKRTISLVILDYILFEVEQMHTTYRFYDRKNEIELTDVLEVHIVELPKLNNIISQHKNNPEIPWLMFLNAGTEEELKMAAKAEPKISKAYNRLIEMSDDEENRRLYEERITQIIEVDLKIEAAKKEGREEGAIKERINTAKNLILLGMDNEIINKATGLSPDKITQLRSEIKPE